MAITVKKAILWRKELENRPGTLAEALKPLAEAGVSLQVVMGYAFPGEKEHAAVEVYPIAGGKAEQAANQAGLVPSPSIACLVVQGDDRPGLGHLIADKLASEGINISFVMVQVTGRKYLGVFGFGTQSDADKAISIVKDADKAVSKAGHTRKTVGTRRKASAARGVKRKPTKTAATKAGAKKKVAKKSATRKVTVTARSTKTRQAKGKTKKRHS